jgi:hypothetical protein
MVSLNRVNAITGQDMPELQAAPQHAQVIMKNNLESKI